MASKVLSKEKEEQLNKQLRDFETRFQYKQQEQEKAREEYYRAKAERTGVSVEEIREQKRKHTEVVTIYKAKTAANTFKAKKAVSES
ncbi:MAG: hypothetical protein Q4E99_03365, partial [Bacillota bacterium]|nr:hypothetical protein [Bacillota bacterium]